MKLFLRLILIGLLSYLLSFIFPWWIVLAIGFSVGISIPGGSFSVFVSGFLGVGIVWMSYAWKLDATNGSAFSSVILEILPVGDSLSLIAIVGLVGGLCGGFSSMTGSLLRQPKVKTKTGSYYQ